MILVSALEPSLAQECASSEPSQESVSLYHDLNEKSVDA